MRKAPHSLIALYDANPEHAHFESPILSAKARALGTALGKAGLGIVARIGSPIVGNVLSALSDTAGLSVLLSPAATRMEHENAYRLPFFEHPIIFTGRGALGTDTIALSSASAVIIFGSYPEVLENILECAQDCRLPIAVLTDEDPTDIHERIRAVYPHLTAQLLVSHDPQILVHEIADELRRRQLEQKLSK